MAVVARLSRAERALNGLVLAGVSLPLLLSSYALFSSVAFSPAAIERQEHLAWLGVSLAPCPGCGLCGMSRAFSAFAHGDFSLAVAYHAGVVVVFPVFCVLVAVCAVGLLRLVRSPLRLPAPALTLPTNQPWTTP